jgi:hypothetical protein
MIASTPSEERLLSLSILDPLLIYSPELGVWGANTFDVK